MKKICLFWFRSRFKHKNHQSPPKPVKYSRISFSSSTLLFLVIVFGVQRIGCSVADTHTKKETRKQSKFGIFSSPSCVCVWVCGREWVCLCVRVAAAEFVCISAGDIDKYWERSGIKKKEEERIYIHLSMHFVGALLGIEVQWLRHKQIRCFSFGWEAEAKRAFTQRPNSLWLCDAVVLGVEEKGMLLCHCDYGRTTSQGTQCYRHNRRW